MQSRQDTNRTTHSRKQRSDATGRDRLALSLNAKFLIIVLPSVVIITLLFMAFFAHYTHQTLRKDLDNEVLDFAKSFSNTVDDLMWNYQTKELGSALAAVSSSPNVLRAEVYTPDGKLVVARGYSLEEVGNGFPAIRQPIFHLQPAGDRFDLGELVLHYSYAETDKLHDKQTLLAGLQLLLVAAIITISAIFAYRRTIGIPLAKFLSAIRETRESGKWVMVDWESQDEIGELIATRNELVKRIDQKEKDLADSERRYRQLFDNAQVGIFKTRPDGTLSEANQTIAELMGFDTIEEFKSINAGNRYADPEERATLWRHLEKNGEVSNFKARIICKDNSLIWVEFSGKLDPDGSLNGIMVDITARVEAEQILEERDELHRAFFEENKAVMLLYNPKDSSIQFANPAACYYYGYSNDELTSMTKSQLNRMSEGEIFTEMQQAATERRGYFNFIHTMKDNTLRDVEVYTGPISMGNRQLHYSIVHDVTEKRRLERKLERMATRDQLTGALNRHAFFEMAKNELARAHRYNRPTAMLMLDLDHFKQINDTYGHATGDDVLRVFALTCRAELRDTDLYGRMGGEEFAAMLVETDEEQAMVVAERLRSIIKNTIIPTDDEIQISITVSIGVSMQRENDTVTRMLKRADQGLYDAKETGRNKIVKV